MNKRIKNKINKRIMEKLQSDNGLLTQFEYDYLLKCGPKDLKLKKINMKISDYIFKKADESLDKYKKAPAMVYWYAANAKVHPFQNLIDAMDSVDSLRYSLENIEAYHTVFNTDETGEILSAGHGKQSKKETETYFKHIAEIDEEAYEDESREWLNVKEPKNKVYNSSTKPEIDLNKNDLWYKPIEPKGAELHIFNGNDFVPISKNGEEVNGLHESVDRNSASYIEISMMTKEEHNEINSYKPSNDLLSESKEPVFYEPSTWKKLKGKMKGWLCK